MEGIVKPRTMYDMSYLAMQKPEHDRLYIMSTTTGELQFAPWASYQAQNQSFVWGPNIDRIEYAMQTSSSHYLVRFYVVIFAQKRQHFGGI